MNPRTFLMVELYDGKEVRRGESGRKAPGGLFGMHIRVTSEIKVKSLLLALAACLWAVLGCSAEAGGKGPSRTQTWSLDTEQSSEMSDDTVGAATDSGPGSIPDASLNMYMAPSENDPFGLLPADWPDNVPLHPEAAVAHSGEFGSEGYYMVTLVSPNLATIPGVQSFHIDSLSMWQSMEIDEVQNNGAAQLIIIAEQPGEYVKIISEQATAGFLVTLDNADYWEQRVGPDPIVVRIFFSKVPPPE